jgi:hypothetical protein
MFRSGASRSILRSLNTSTTNTLRATNSPIRQQARSQLCTVARRPLPSTALKPLAPKTLALARWQSRDERPTVDKIDTTREKEIGEKHTIRPTPERVSASSTTSADVAMTPGGDDPEPKMMAGVYGDIVRFPPFECYLWDYVY